MSSRATPAEICRATQVTRGVQLRLNPSVLFDSDRAVLARHSSAERRLPAQTAVQRETTRAHFVSVPPLFGATDATRASAASGPNSLRTRLTYDSRTGLAAATANVTRGIERKSRACTALVSLAAKARVGPSNGHAPGNPSSKRAASSVTRDIVHEVSADSSSSRHRRPNLQAGRRSNEPQGRWVEGQRPRGRQSCQRWLRPSLGNRAEAQSENVSARSTSEATAPSRDSPQKVFANRELDVGSPQHFDSGERRRHNPRADECGGVAGSDEFATEDVGGALMRYERRATRQGAGCRLIRHGVRPVPNGPENVHAHSDPRASYSLAVTGRVTWKRRRLGSSSSTPDLHWTLARVL